MEVFWKRVDRFLQIGLWALAGALLMAVYTERFTWGSALFEVFLPTWLVAAVLSAVKHLPAAIRWLTRNWRGVALALLGFLLLNEAFYAFVVWRGAKHASRGDVLVASTMLLCFFLLVSYVRYDTSRREQNGSGRGV